MNEAQTGLAVIAGLILFVVFEIAVLLGGLDGAGKVTASGGILFLLFAWVAICIGLSEGNG